MHPEDRTECTPLKPAHQKLLERLVRDITAEESSDIGSPPGNSCHSHIQACLKLFPHGAEGRMNVSRPGQDCIFLAARPCAAHQAQDILLSLRLKAFIEAFRISHRIHVAALQRRSRIVAVIVKIIRTVFRLSLIQPEAADALLIIIFLTFLPHKFLCARMGRIVEDCISHPCHVVLIAAVRIDQIAHLIHGTEILAALIDGRPDRDNCLDSHLFQLFYHCFRIRPVSRLKLEVALSGPVEEIDDDGIHRQASSLVLSRHRQKLILSAVTQLALPVSKTILRHHRGTPCCSRILLLDFRRRIARCDKVIQLFRTFGTPLCLVGSERRCTDRRVVPEKTVASAGNHKRNTCLAVSVSKLQHRALFVQMLLLVLSHSENLLVVKRLEPCGQLKFLRALDRLQLSAGDSQGHTVSVDPVTGPPVFFRQQLSLLVVKADPSLMGNLRRNLSIDQCRLCPGLMILGIFL